MLHPQHASAFASASVSSLTKVNQLCSGPGCSKLTMSLVNMSLKFQTLISQIHQYFLLKKLLSFFQQKYQCLWL